MTKALVFLLVSGCLGLVLGACPFHYYLRPRVIDPRTGKAIEEPRVIVVTASRIQFLPASQFSDQYGRSGGIIYSPTFEETPQGLENELPVAIVTEKEEVMTTTRRPEVTTRRPEATTKAPEVTTKAPEVTTKAQEVPTTIIKPEVTEKTTKKPEDKEEMEEEYDDYYDEEPKELTEAQKKALALLNSINFDVDVKNVTLVEARVACAVDDGPCDEIGEGVKGIIDFLQSDRCESCTSENRGDLYKGILVVKHQLPHRYKQLLDKYEGGVEPIELEAF